MASGDRSEMGSWLPRVRILEGQPWQVYGHELTPVMRILSLGSGKWRFRWLRPLAVRVRGVRGQREIGIRCGGIPISVVLVGCLAPVALWLLARRRA